MNEFNNEAGYIGPQFLFVLLFLAAIAYGTGFLVSTTMRSERSSREYTRQLESIQEIVTEVFEAIKEDPTPKADTPDDPVWDLNNTVKDGYTIHIRSLSGSINVNFIRKDILDKTDLGKMLIDGKTPADLQQQRYDNRLALHPSEYEGFFRSETFDSNITCYGWANINLIEEFALERYIESLTGSTSRGESYHAKFQQSLLDKKVFTNESLRLFFGLDYREVYPYINAEPQLNINFAHEFLIREIVGYPLYGLENPESRAASLIQERTQGIDSVESIASILGVPKDHPLCQWFGCVTWFWEIFLEGPGRKYRFVVCRIPDDTIETAFEPVYHIIERGFVP